MSDTTAGKGPGVVLRAQNHSGAVRVSTARTLDRGMLQVLDRSGQVVEVGLNPRELRDLADALRRVALILTAQTLADETTQA